MTQTDRIQITYDLTFAAPFHCGTGIREALIDRTVVRDGRGYLYVPGSTFKGVLREHCEHLALFYGQDIAIPHDDDAALQGLGNGKPTMVTRIFGSHNMPGLLFFDDAHQAENDLPEYDSPEYDEKGEHTGKGKYKNLQVSISTQVRLDRPTGTAVPGALYTSEYGTSDMVFKGTIQGWLQCTAVPLAIEAGTAQQSTIIPTYSLLLLLAGLHMIERIGGNKSSGKGRCACTITTLAINGTEVQKNTWEAWLMQLDKLTLYKEEG